MCQCREAVQNAAHVWKCKLVVVGKGEEWSAENMEFCSAVYNILWDREEGHVV